MQLKLGTRTSKMAMYQAELVKSLLLKRHPELDIQLVPIKSEGDIPNHVFQGKGAFIKKLDEALLRGKIDFAVNCMKDIPNDHERNQKIGIIAVLPRDDIREVLIFKKGFKPTGAEKDFSFTIGTSSPRRCAILKKIYPKIHIKEIRGSADTRVRKLDEGVVDALVLAHAGLARINLSHRANKIYAPSEFLPPLGAGILTLDALKNNQSVISILKTINDAKTQQEMLLERAFLNQIRGDCHTAMGGYIHYADGNLYAQMTVFSPEDNIAYTANIVEQEDADPESLGIKLADQILAQQ